MSLNDSTENIPAGIGWMVITMLFFVSMDTIAKYLMQHYSLIQVLWARFFIHTFWVLVYMGMAGSLQVRTNRLSLQMTRSVLLVTVTIFFFLGIRQVPLATASVIMFLAPIIVTLLAIPLLGEKVGPRRIIGVGIGFLGALVTIRPGMADFQVGMLFMLVAAACHALYLIVTRKIRAFDAPLTSLFYTGITGAVILTAVVPFYWQMPTPFHCLLFVLMGLVGSVSHLCLIRAFRIAPASAVAPYSYSGLIWSVSLGWLVFSDIPDIWVWLGAVLIIGSGLYIYFREQKVKEATAEQ